MIALVYRNLLYCVVIYTLTIIPGCLARPIREGKTDLGASSPAKPAVVVLKCGEGTDFSQIM